MSTDSTELTFVRCPSCRSLVPAISTRCRMCGATLEASASTENSDQEERKSGRVRQRTMSDGDAGVSSAVSQVRQEENLTANAGGATITPIAELGNIPEEEISDPLSAYIEELDSKGEEPALAEDDINAQETAPVIESGDSDDNEDEDEIEVKDEPEFAQPKVTIESGRKPGKSQLNFGAPAKEPQHAANGAKDSHAEHKASQPAPQHTKPQHQEQQRKQEHNRPHQQQGGGQRGQPQQQGGGNQARADSHNKPQQQQQPAKQQAAQPQQRQSSFQPSANRAEGTAGRLFGWLVNYSDPAGNAVEIREGKYFLSSKSVKPTDLVINDKSISSPHALLVVGAGSGLSVQDLMSERGVFVRRKGSDTYKQEEEAVTVVHGDWLRFGDVEFLVSLIAHPGEV